MRVERTTIILALLLVVAVGMGKVLADPSNPTGIAQISSETGNVTGTSQSLQAQAGNVTELSINSTTITSSWAGFYGNVSGNITLQDASGDVFYNWAVASPSGEIFASINSGIDWSTINCSNAANITSEEGVLGQSASDGDSVTNTFSGTTHPDFDVGTTTLTSCPSTNTFDNGGAQSTKFFNVLLNDGASRIVYTTLLNASSIGFDGSSYDFQILVGEDGHGVAASTTTTTYFFVELN